MDSWISRLGQSLTISVPEIEDYRRQFERLNASRAKLAKFHPSKSVESKARVKRDQERAGEVPPQELNKTWPEFLELILARNRRAQVIGGTEDEPGYLQTAERCRRYFNQYHRLAEMPIAARQLEAQKPDLSRDRAFVENKPGDFLLSHTLARAVPSGLKGLTTVFGMGTGGTPSLRSPRSVYSGWRIC